MLAIAGAMLSLAACASTGTRAASCVLQPSDSAYAARGPVYRDCAVDEKVSLQTDRLHPDFQASPSNSPNSCYIAELEFVVDTMGHVEVNTAKVLRTNDQNLVQAEMNLLPQLRYNPAKRNGAKVRQITTKKETIQTMRIVVRSSSPPPTLPAAPRPTC